MISLSYRIWFLAISPIFLSSYALADYQENLPYSITLTGGQSSTQNAIAWCYSGCAFGYNGGRGSDFSISTSGNTNASLTLNATLPPNPPANTKIVFYMNNVSINPHSTLVLRNFSGVIVNGTMNLNNSTLTFENPGSNDASFQISKQLTLTNQSHLNITANGFTNYHSGNIEINHSTLNVNTTSEFNNQNNITNNHGTITIAGSFYNIGQEIRNAGIGNSSSIANFINNGGDVSITGDFHNGGQKSTGNCYQGCGGGNLINTNGGTITIKGNLISEMKDNQPSSVQIHGGKIKVNNMTNGTGSTLIFSSYNGQMGQLEGNVRNNGTIKADISGVEIGSHTLIQGNLSGATQNIEILSGNDKNELVTSSVANGILTIGKNTQAIDTYLLTLQKNQAIIIDTLSLYTYNKNTREDIANNLTDTAQSMLYYVSPMSLWSVRENTLVPLKRQIYPQSNISIAPFAIYVSNGILKSPLYGATINFQHKYKKHSLSGFATYATTNATQTATYSKIKSDTNTFLIGMMDRIFLSSTEITLSGYYGLASNKNQRDFTTGNSEFATFDSSYSYNEIGLSASIGNLIKMGGTLHIKPFAGFDYILGRQDAFHESSTSNIIIPSFSAPSYFSQLPQITAGIQTQYFLTRWQSILFNTQIQYNLIKAPAYSIYLNSSRLKFSPNYKLAYTLDFGYSLYLNKQLSINIHALYNHSFMGFQAYSGIANLSYRF